PGGGACLSVMLPRSAEATPPPARSRATVLLAHDSRLTRDLVAERLRAEGYAAMVASSGHIAMGLAAAHRGRIDLVITGVTLPDMTGAALVEAVRSARGPVPDMYIAPAGGNDGDSAPAPPRPAEGGAVVSSPVSLDDLLQAVRSTLDRA